MPSRILKTVYSTNTLDLHGDNISNEWRALAAGRNAKLPRPARECCVDHDVNLSPTAMAEDSSPVHDLGLEDAETLYAPATASSITIEVVKSPNPTSQPLYKIVKSAKEKRRISVFRDADFMRQMQALLVNASDGSLDPTSVSKLSPHLPSQ